MVLASIKWEEVVSVNLSRPIVAFGNSTSKLSQIWRYLGRIQTVSKTPAATVADKRTAV